MALLSLIACQSNLTLKEELVGKWSVSIIADSTGEKSISESVQSAVDSGLEIASKELDTAMDSVDFNLTIETDGDTQQINTQKLEEGLKSLAKGLDGLFEGLAQLGKGLTRMFDELLEINVHLQPDGSMQFTSPNDEIEMELNEEQLRWSISDEQFILDSESEVDTFTVKRLERGFLLKGQDATFRLDPIKQP